MIGPRLATAAEIDRVIAELLPPLLQHAGFEPIGRGRRWVRARTPLRDVFELASLKGASLGPRWGISLDFVPHVRGESVRSHRTNKGAVSDIVFDPIDFFSASSDWLIGGLGGDRGVRDDAARVLPAAARAALDWFASFDAENLLSRIEEHRRADRHGGRFGFDDWVQQPLAYAFVLAWGSRVDEARAELDRWAEGTVSRRTAKRLHAMLDACAARPLGR